MPLFTDKQVDALKIISKKLHNKKYAVRGTASLVLQKIDMNVDDVDIVCDEATALNTNDLFKDFLVEPVSYRESPKFKSFFGKFNIAGVDVEIMGEWQVKDKKGEWSRVFDGSNFTVVDLEDFSVNVTKIEDELEMFILMGRFTAYHKIKKQLRGIIT